MQAYSVYDEEIGYCQGQSFLAAVLLLHVSSWVCVTDPCAWLKQGLRLGLATFLDGIFSLCVYKLTLTLMALWKEIEWG